MYDWAGLASTNTRPEGFENPVVLYDKNDVDNIMNELSNHNLVIYFTQESKSSKWKFFKYLDLKYNVYEMNTPIGKANKTNRIILSKVPMRKH